MPKKSESPKPRVFKTYTASTARRHWGRLLREVQRGAVVEIERRGELVAAMLRAETLETLEILASPDAMQAVREFEAGKMEFFDVDELTAKPPKRKGRQPSRASVREDYGVSDKQLERAGAAIRRELRADTRAGKLVPFEPGRLLRSGDSPGSATPCRVTASAPASTKFHRKRKASK